jgi:hypothetical protein
MASETIENAREKAPPCRIDAEGLARFLDELKSSGYRIGSDQHVLAADLLAALAARGGLPATAEFAQLLSPLVCKSARQQVEFPGKLERWLQTSLQHAAVAAAPKTSMAPDSHRLAGFLNRIERRNRIGAWVMAAVVVGVIGAAVWVYRPRVGPPQAPTSIGAATLAPPPTKETVNEVRKQAAVSVGAILLACAGLLVFFGGAWALIWRRRARLFLSRRSDAAPPDITQVNVQAMVEALLPAPVIAPLARAMRRRVELPSTDIAVEPTLEQTLNHGGWFTPVYGRIRVPPEYLILVNRTGSLDPGAALARELMVRLSRSAVIAQCFYFDNDPRVLVPFKPMRGRAWDQGRPILLREVESLYGNLRLVVVADAGAIAAMAPAEVDAWTGRFSGWADRNLLSTAPVDGFSPGHSALARQFTLFLASESGFAELGRKLETGRSTLHSAVVSLPPVPEILLTRPAQWLEPMEPDTHRIDGLFLALRAYLGANGFRWLAACAAYPVIHANLTLYLGQTLHREDGSPVFQPLTLACLNRLVWFRQGHMPNWLRIALLNSMSPEAERETRSALEGLLIGALSGDISKADVQIAQEHKEVVSRLMRPIIRRLAATAEPGGPFGDRVFLAFLSGRNAIGVPRTLRNLLTTGSLRGRLHTTPDFSRRQIRTPRVLMLAAVLAAAFVAVISAALSFYSFVVVPFAILLGMVLVRAVWRTRSPWVLWAMLHLSYCFVAGWAGLVAMLVSPWLLILVGAVLLVSAIVFRAAWVGLAFRREPAPIGPMRRAWGYAGLAGIGVFAILAPTGLLISRLEWLAYFALFLMPGPVGAVLAFAALPTKAEWMLRSAMLCIFAYSVFLFFALGQRGLIVAYAAFGLCLLYCFVQAVKEWRRLSIARA